MEEEKPDNNPPKEHRESERVPVIFTILNIILTVCMVVITYRLVYWTSKLWEASEQQAEAAKTQVKVANEQVNLMKRMNEDTKSLANETIKYSKEQAEAAKKSVEASKSSADAANLSAQTAKQSLDLERSKSKAKLECRIWKRRLFASILTKVIASDSVSEGIGDSAGIHRNTNTSYKNDDIKISPKQYNINKSASTNIPSDAQRTQVILICINHSSRPTAVIDIYLRDKNGNHLGEISRGYNNQIKLPFQVGPWGVTMPMEFEVAWGDEEKMKDLFILDMENKEYIIPCPSIRTRQKG